MGTALINVGVYRKYYRTAWYCNLWSSRLTSVYNVVLSVKVLCINKVVKSLVNLSVNASSSFSNLHLHKLQIKYLYKLRFSVYDFKYICMFYIANVLHSEAKKFAHLWKNTYRNSNPDFNHMLWLLNIPTVVHCKSEKFTKMGKCLHQKSGSHFIYMLWKVTLILCPSLQFLEIQGDIHMYILEK
jgi:L-lactate permease